MTDWEQKTQRVTTTLSCWLAVKAGALTVEEALAGTGWSEARWEASIYELLAAEPQVGSRSRHPRPFRRLFVRS